MIGSLRGTVLERSPAGQVLLEVGGVGYRVSVPVGALADLEPGQPAFLFTHHHVRDDAMVLFGFPTRDERDTFEAVLGASGVGPKLALAILSVHSPSALRSAVLDRDLDALTMVPGVGKRTAQRLLVELEARLAVPETVSASNRGAGSNRAEVRSALAGLGYEPDEIRAVLAQLGDGGARGAKGANGANGAAHGASDSSDGAAGDASVEALLRDALKLLAVSRG